MAQQARRLGPGQSLNGASSPQVPRPTPLRTRGSAEDRTESLRTLEAGGSSLDEMRSFRRAFVITDPYEQSRIDQWRERPGEYVAETLYNLPKNVWSTVKSIPELYKLGKGVQSEVAGAAVSKLGDLVGKDIENVPIPRMFADDLSLREMAERNPSLGLSFGRENLDALSQLPGALKEHYGQYLRPEGRATIIHDDPLGVFGDVSAGFGTVLKAPTIARGLNALSKRPVLAGSAVGLGTFTVTQDFTNSWRAAISAYGMAKARKFFDAKMAEMELGKVTRADNLTKAQLQQTWDDAERWAKNLNARDAYLAREAADTAKDVRIHQVNLDKIDNASSVAAMEGAVKKAQFHLKYAKNINPSERATILAAIEESVTNRRLVLSSEQAIKDSAVAARQQMAEGRESAGIMNQQQARLAKEAADEAAMIREAELFPAGREALSPTATETSARLNRGMRTSVSQRFQQPSVEPPMIPSHVSSSNPARSALDDMIETKVAPLKSKAGSVPITRVTGAEGAMIAETIADIRSGAKRILTTEEMKYPEIREAWELAQAQRQGMTHAARPASATSAEREAIIQIEARKNRTGRR